MAAPPVDIPCAPWTTDEEIRECCTRLEPDFDLTDVIGFVSEVLYRMSGKQFPGECTKTIWPCQGSNCGCCRPGWSNGSWWWQFNSYPAWPVPNGSGDGFVNIGRCNQACKLERVKLPGTINSIEEVWVDGELLDPSAYKVEAYRWLVRVDGGKWPCTNDLTGEPGDPGVFVVTYSYGKPVPAGGRLAARIFACELAKSRCGAENCLPQRIKSISRQGVDAEFMQDPLEFLKDREVGIYEVDLWLNSINPHKIQRRSRLHRPDRPRGNTTYT